MIPDGFLSSAKFHQPAVVLDLAVQFLYPLFTILNVLFGVTLLHF